MKVRKINMKILSETKLTVVGKPEPTLSQDGRNTYYKIAALQNGQACNLSVSEDVYNAIPAGYVDAMFRTSYDDKYNSFRIDTIVSIDLVNGSKPSGAKSGN